jgi:hypothetical protein
MQWLSLVPFVIVAIVVVYGPGILPGWILGLRRFGLIAVSPLITTTIISLAALGAGFLHLAWNWWPVVITTVMLSGVAWGLSMLGKRLFPRLFTITSPPAHETIDENQPRTTMTRLALVAGIASAIVLATWQFTRIIRGPGNFSQTFDNLFHLNAIRWIMDTGQASSLTLTSMTYSGAQPEFYPAVWHELVSLVAITLGTNYPPFAVNAVIWVLMALIWPLGCLFMLSRIMNNPRPFVLVAAGILTMSFVAAPTWLLWYGVIYPNCLGFALLPIGLGLAIPLFGFSSPKDLHHGHSLLLLLGCAPGLVMTHPGAFLALLAVISPMLLTWAVPQISSFWGTRRRQAWGIVAFTSVVLSVFACVWRLARLEPSWPPRMSLLAAVRQFFLASPFYTEDFWLLGALVVLGFIWMWRHRSLRWWFGPVVVIFLLWVVSAGTPSGWLRYLLVGVFYSDAVRLVSLVPIALFPVTVLAVEALVTWFDRLQEKITKGPRRLLPAVSAVVGLALLVGGIQATPGMVNYLDGFNTYYGAENYSRLVDADELALIEQVPDLVEEGVRVATHATNGSSMLYALTGIPTTDTHGFMKLSGELKLIRYHLRDAGTRPHLVCSALETLNVRYVLDFGPNVVLGKTLPQGFQNLSTAEGFTPIANEGEAVLYRIDACGWEPQP